MRPGRVLALGSSLLVSLALLGGVVASRALSPAGGGTRIFVVSEGATLGSVARDLAGVGLVRSRLATEWWGRLHGLAGELRAGEYELSGALSTPEILEQVVAGRVRTLEVAIPEGFTAREIAERLEERGLADGEAFLAVVHDPASAQRLGVEGESLEGYLFPETYHLARGLAPREVARAFVDQFLEVWRRVGPRARERGLSMHHVVTLASIVEKETGAPEERPLIASVFHNRLARGMRLESDPTTIYGIPGFDGNLKRVHLEDPGNPYNTYLIPALPPGPIANPGEAALVAVVEPAESDYLFFVSRNDGTHVFSRTYREHTNQVNRFQKGKR